MIKVVKILAILIFVTVVGGYLALTIAFDGGISNFINNLRPDINPKSSQINTQRNQSIKKINESFSQLEENYSLKSYATSTYDKCERGEFNYKRMDDFLNLCTYRITKFYGLNGDFSTSMKLFEKELFKLGWTSTDSKASPMDNLIKLYDESKGKKRNDGTPFGGSINGYYDVYDLPFVIAHYKKDNQILSIEMADDNTSDLSNIEYAQRSSSGAATTFFDERNFNNIPELTKTVLAKNKYIFVVSIQDMYFKNR